jgi:16S rRNA (cytosine967-C5)-methyltransferase
LNRFKGQNTPPRATKSKIASVSLHSSAIANISPARSAAFEILQRVADSSAHSDDLLHGPGTSRLSQLDVNLATTLVLGVLRWQLSLDALMRPLLQRPDLTLPTQISTALRMGAFQLLYLDRIPPHAALNESVELVRSAGHGHAAGMVNAILRKIQRQGVKKPKLYETPSALAERLSHPDWLVARWIKNYGRSKTVSICEYDQSEPEEKSLFTEDESDSGLPHMDDGSRLVAELASVSHSEPMRIWDCCAAPGGKTRILSHRHPEATILATDIHPARVAALRGRLLDKAPNVRTVLSDATTLPASEGSFDLILCDVPCSGTGTLSRNPEIKYRIQPSDLSRQSKRQTEILEAALGRLAPGGCLLYSTCSLEPEENEHVVANVLEGKLDSLKLISVKPMLENLMPRFSKPLQAEEIVLGEYLRTIPGNNFRGDGFFAAVFETPK